VFQSVFTFLPHSGIEEGAPPMELSNPIAGARVSRAAQAREWIKRPRVVFALASAAVLLAAAAVLLAVLLWKGGAVGFTCESPFSIDGAVAVQQKGLAVDDSTFRSCPGKIPAEWPNAEAKVASIRLFKAWDSSWPADSREDTWRAVVDFAESNGAKVLLGTQITCSEADDDADWANVLQLLKMLGPDHVMGVAIGNELELLQFKDKKIAPASCIKDIWEGGYLLRKFDEHVRDLDRLGGFGSVPLTSAFGGAIMAAQPFWNTPTARVLDFFQKVIGKYGSRWVYSLNIYPYFDPSNQMDPGSTDSCSQALGRSQCWNDPNACLFPGIVKSMRDRMKAVSSTNNVLWITETGWSSPMSDTLKDKPTHSCKAFSDQDSFQKYYAGFLRWDMQIQGSQGPDHVFYFTIRDSTNFGSKEFFGLVPDCAAAQCKLQKPNSGPGPSPSPSPTPGPAPLPGPAACSAYEKCKGLKGNCCPTDAGTRLWCCPTAG